MPDVAELPPDEEAALSMRRVGGVIAGKFRLDQLLGVGGMAAVYAVTHLNNSKRFALKVLHPTIATQPEVKKRFLREGYIANQVNHPGAVSVLDDGADEDGTVYLVMELLEGQSMRALAEKNGGRVPPKQLVRYVIDMLDVLAAAHEAGIVHRDLKADNVFVTTEGAVKVLDFGVARIRDAGDGKTRTGLVMGTPEYMPPEQARGRSEQIDGRTDLWAVGAMMFKLLTGKHPHEAETANEVLLLAMTEPAPKLASVLSDVNPKLAELVDTALEFEQNSRFRDAKRMQAAAREVLTALEDGDAVPTAVGLDANLIVASAKTDVAEATPSNKGLWIHDKARPAPTPKAKLSGSSRRGLLALGAVVLALGGVFAIVSFQKLHAQPSVPWWWASAGSASALVVVDAGPPVVVTAGADASEAEEAGVEDEITDEEDNPYADIDASLSATTTALATPKPTSVAPMLPKKPPPKIGTTRPKKKKR